MARTGSGKTATFLVPMFQKLRQHVLGGGPRALVLSLSKPSSSPKRSAGSQIKTEGGKNVQGSKTGIYKKWKERWHRQISVNGSATENIGQEDAVHAGGRQIRGNGWHFGGRNNWHSVPNANAPSELRDPEQVRKDRQQKASRIGTHEDQITDGEVW